MLRTQAWRNRFLQPLLVLLTRLHITADHLTLLSLLAGLAFCPMFFWSKWAAFGMLALHVLLDGLDGPLARHNGTASRKGSFTDTLTDQSVVVASTITLMLAHTVSIVPGGLYIFLYTVVVVFAMVRNAMFIPYSWVVRPRFFVFAWLAIEIGFWPGSTNYLLWVCNGLLAWKMLTGFVHIRKKL